MATARDLFERRACATCHTVTVTDAQDGLPWRVEPVRLTQRFLPHARFSHAAHETGMSGCSRCHNAAQSTLASDILIPDIDTCRECHGSGLPRRNPEALIPSTCVMCHDFHFPDHGALQ
jgi:predicted CXXCH cytochrome family protein